MIELLGEPYQFEVLEIVWFGRQVNARPIDGDTTIAAFKGRHLMMKREPEQWKTVIEDDQRACARLDVVQSHAVVFKVTVFEIRSQKLR